MTMNNATLLILEFIQTTGLMLYAKRYPLYAINSTNSYVRIYKLFMQNKANFRKSQMNVISILTTDYENISDWTLGENKPNLVRPALFAKKLPD